MLAGTHARRSIALASKPKPETTEIQEAPEAPEAWDSSVIRTGREPETRDPSRTSLLSLQAPGAERWHCCAGVAHGHFWIGRRVQESSGLS